MSLDLSLKEMKKEWHGSLRSYLIGLFLSLALTLLSFGLIFAGLSGRLAIFSLITLAIIQALVQLTFFLHLWAETKPRWGIMSFFFMLGVLLVIVFGSLWIMHDLNERVMKTMKVEAGND